MPRRPFRTAADCLTTLAAASCVFVATSCTISGTQPTPLQIYLAVLTSAFFVVAMLRPEAPR